jgi:hypothetical protein
MKKFIIIAVLVALAVTGGLLIRQPAIEAQYTAASFMPQEENLSNIFLTGFEDIGKGMEKTAETMDFVSSLFKDIYPETGQADTMAREISLRLKEFAPLVKDSLFMLSIRPDGMSVQPRFWGALGIDSSEPKELIDTFVDQLVQTNPDIVMFPYTIDLGSEAESLYQLMDTDTGLTLFTALYKSEPSYVIASTSEESLAKMIEAAKEEEKRYLPKRHYQHENFIYATIDNQTLRMVVKEEEATIQSDEPLVFDTAFYTEGNDSIVKIYSNAARLFLDKEKIQNMSFVSGTQNFYGGDRILGFILGKMKGLDRDYVKSLLAGPQNQDTRKALDEIERAYSITLQDIIDLFTGEASVVMGGKAGSVIGRIPGLYLSLRPEKEDIATKFASLFPNLGMGLPVNEIPLDGWEKAYSMNQFITLTVASRKNELLLGILDAYGLNKPSDIPENLQPFLDMENYGLLAISVKDMLPVLNDLFIMAQSFKPDPSLATGRVIMNRLLEGIETFSCVSLSPEEAELKISYREKTDQE